METGEVLDDLNAKAGHITTEIAELMNAMNPPDGMGLKHSRSIGKLTEALTKAALEFGEIVKDTENPYFKSSYADLATLIRATRPALAKHGLAIIQSPKMNEAGAVVTTLLTHSSGEWLADDLALPATKRDAQGMGSAITYARRYAYQSILNIAGEEDDDGNAAVGKSQSDRKSSSTESGPGCINPVQQRAFLSACKSGGRTDSQIIDYLRTMGIDSGDLEQSIEMLPKGSLNDAIKWAFNKAPIEPAKEIQRTLDAKKPNPMAKVFAVAKKRGISENDIRSYAQEQFNTEHLSQLSAEQVEDVSKWIESV